jgi:hypothetical protein
MTLSRTEFSPAEGEKVDMKTYQGLQGPSTKLTSLTLTCAALTIVLLIPSGVMAQRSGARRGVVRRSERERPRWTKGELSKRSHIPPIIIGDGSVTFETGELTHTEQSGLLPHKYTLAGHTRLSRASIMELPADGGYDYYAVGSLGRGWQVRVWLEELDPRTGRYMPVTEEGFPPGQPAIVVSSDGTDMVLETRKPLGECLRTENPDRPCRYDLLFFSPERHLRIRKVQVFRAGSEPYDHNPFEAKRKVNVRIWFSH